MSQLRQQDKKIFCKCCLKLLGQEESRIPVTEKTRVIFFKFIRFPLPQQGVLCGKCNINLLIFDSFQREVRQRHNLVSIAEKGERVKAQRQENVMKKIKQENPLEITDVTDETGNQCVTETLMESPAPRISNHSNINTINHKSWPVDSRKKPRYGLDDLNKLRATQKLAASIKAQSRNRVSLFRVMPPKTTSSTTSSSSTDSVETISADDEFPIVATSSAESHDTLSADEHPESDDEVILLPPEPPIDLDNFEENQPKPISTDKMFKCDHCNAVSTKREIIVAHIQQSHSFACVEKCGKVYPTEKRMIEHVVRVHKKIRMATTGNKRKQSLVARERDIKVNFRMQGMSWETL